MGRRPVHVVGLNSTNSTRSSSQTVRMVCRSRASMASVNTLRRYSVDEHQMCVPQATLWRLG